jgi:formate dehydrogenase maturation protein FdhE
MNETYIYCNHCSGDMNGADWSANRGRCLHCGQTIDPRKESRRQEYQPLEALHRRLLIQSFLAERNFYV